MADLEHVDADGRRARRDRGREAVIEALFELLREGAVSLRADAIVERSGVSLSSIFRYFSSIDDLQRETIDRYFERFAPRFEIPAIGKGALADRVRRYVDARLDLYEAIAPIGRLARVRAREHPRIGASLQETRTRLAAQVVTHFQPEIRQRSPAQADDLVALVATMTSFEAWDLLSESHQRSRSQIRRAWITATRALFELRGAS